MSLVVTLNPDSEKFDQAGIAELCPLDIMKSETVTTALKKRKWSSLLSPEDLKGAYFDPTPLPEETTIAKYHKRIMAQLPQDRKELHLFIPFDKALDAAMDKLTKVESDMAETKTKHESDMAELKAKFESDMAEIKTNQQSGKFKLFYGNMLISLARKLAKTYKPTITDDECTTRLQQFAMSIEDKQLRDAGVPPKIWSQLRKINKVCTLYISLNVYRLI